MLELTTNWLLETCLWSYSIFRGFKLRKSLITSFQGHQLCFVHIGAKVVEGLKKCNEGQICCKHTGLFEIIVGVLTTCHLVLRMQLRVVSFYGLTSRIRFSFLLFPEVSRD